MEKLPQIFITLDIEVQCPHCEYTHTGNELLTSNFIEITDLIDSYGGNRYASEHDLECKSCGKWFKGEVR